MSYKKELLGKLEELRKEVESAKRYSEQIAQDYSEEYYFSDNYGDYWESASARYDADIAGMFLSLLAEMKDSFEKLAPA
jgi:hypothetical protein